VTPKAAQAICGLYAITPDGPDTEALCRKVEQALAGGVRVLQYRRKSVEPAIRLSEAGRLARLCEGSGCLFVVNDDPALARALDAPAVHLGRDDGTVAAARSAAGHRLIVGVSCYDELDRAQRAVDEGADYIAFGSFFPSRVKPGAVRPPVDLLTRASSRFDVPVVAIGGITTENAPSLIAAGADALAVISDLFDAEDIEAKADQYRRLFAVAGRSLP
jgi:thiamine-phosphate pyrophosphorylase